MDIATRQTQVANGVRVITERLPHSRSAGLSVLIDTGPQDEPLEKRGLAHLCEHAIFLGTSQRNSHELAKTIDTAGGCFGAFTAPDYTCVYAHVLEDYVTYAMDIIGDILVDSTVPAAALHREKDVICQEILRYADDPEDLLLQMVKNSIWPHDSLSRSVTGAADEVALLERCDVMQFIQQHYLPGRMIVAAAGAIEHDSIVEQVEDAFWNLADRDRPRTTPTQAAVPAGGQVLFCPRNIAQCHFSLAIPTFPYTDDRRYAMHVLCNLLGGGMSSRLFHALREESGLVYSIQSTMNSYRRGGVLEIQGATSPELLVQSIHSALSQLVMLSLSEQPVDAEELWKSKMQVRSQSRLGTDMISNRVSSIATQAFHFGGRISDDAVLAAIDSVRMDDIQRIAAEVLLGGLEKLSIAVVGAPAVKNSVFSELMDLHTVYSAIGRETQGIQDVPAERALIAT